MQQLVADVKDAPFPGNRARLCDGLYDLDHLVLMLTEQVQAMADKLKTEQYVDKELAWLTHIFVSSQYLHDFLQLYYSVNEREGLNAESTAEHPSDSSSSSQDARGIGRYCILHLSFDGDQAGPPDGEYGWNNGYG